LISIIIIHAGTIAIEAAMFASAIAPGSIRFGGPVNNVTTSSKQFEIVASDRNGGAIENTRTNARRANVENLISASQCSFSAHQIWNLPKKPICVVTNPPHGLRLDASRELYQVGVLSTLDVIERLSFKFQKDIGPSHQGRSKESTNGFPLQRSIFGPSSWSANQTPVCVLQWRHHSRRVFHNITMRVYLLFVG
jgi:hypothetical protein